MNISILPYKRAQKWYKTEKPYPCYYSAYDDHIYVVSFPEELTERILMHEILHQVLSKHVGTIEQWQFDNISHTIEKMLFE